MLLSLVQSLIQFLIKKGGILLLLFAAFDINVANIDVDAEEDVTEDDIAIAATVAKS